MNSVLAFLGMKEILIIFFAIAILLILPILAIVDILKGNFKNNDKLIWILVVIFFGVIGALLYYIIGRKQKIN